MEKNTFVGVEEIEFWYREHCKDIDINFSKSNFTKFLKFLEVDVFDWVKSNNYCFIFFIDPAHIIWHSVSISTSFFL